MQEWKLCLIATELLPLCLIIEMGKIRLCKADHNYSLPPPLLAGDSDKKKPHKVIGGLKKSFSLARSYVARVVTIKRFYWATQYNQICEESNLQFNGVSYITSLFFPKLKLLVNS